MKYVFLLISIFLSTSLSFAFDSAEEFEEFRAASEAIFSQLDGEWAGEISGLELQGDYPGQPYNSEILIRIDGTDVVVVTKRNDEWYEMPYNFTLVRYKTHAIIYAFAAQDAWVEGFSFMLTMNGVDEMALVWSRVVNNYAWPVEEMESRGYFQGFSLLERY